MFRLLIVCAELGVIKAEGLENPNRGRTFGEHFSASRKSLCKNHGHDLSELNCSWIRQFGSWWAYHSTTGYATKAKPMLHRAGNPLCPGPGESHVQTVVLSTLARNTILPKKRDFTTWCLTSPSVCLECEGVRSWDRSCQYWLAFWIVATMMWRVANQLNKVHVHA